MAKIRTFIAVLLSDGLKRTIASIQDEFKKQAPDLKWVEIGNLHVTLKFLGDVEEQSLDTIHNAMGHAASGFAPFELTVAGAGAFPNARRPRVVWVGIPGGAEALSSLAGKMESALEAAGFPKEDKKFRSHITIGRVRDHARAPDLSQPIAGAGLEPLGVETVDRVVLMRSELRPGGPIYTPLREVELSKSGGS